MWQVVTKAGLLGVEGRATLRDDMMKKKAQEDKSNSIFSPYLERSFTISTYHCPSPQPCTGLADQTGTEIRFAFSIDGVPLSTIPLPHYRG